MDFLQHLNENHKFKTANGQRYFNTITFSKGWIELSIQGSNCHNCLDYGTFDKEEYECFEVAIYVDGRLTSGIDLMDDKLFDKIRPYYKNYGFDYLPKVFIEELFQEFSIKYGLDQEEKNPTT